MVDLRLTRDVGSLTQRTYTLQPARSRTARVAIWVGALACAVAVGAAAMAWYGSHHAASHTQCVSLPVSPDAAQAELERAQLARAQLALARESTARAAVQKAADASSAEVSRLNTELLFLRGQRQKSH